MDPGTIIAVLDLSSKVLSLIVKYYSDVKDAKEDMVRLKAELGAFHGILQRVQTLVQKYDATKLPSSTLLATAIETSLSDIEKMEQKLEPNKGKRAMSRVGFRALKWPFSKKEVVEHITGLEGHKTTLALALSSDQTSLVLGIDENVSQIQRDQNLAEQDRLLEKLLVADGATFDSYFRQYEPQCVQNTRVDLLRQIQAWNTEDDKCIFWLTGMAGTGKSTIARTVASAFADQQCLGASFFFSRGVGELGRATRFVSTLAHQLASLSPVLKQNISRAILDHETITRQGLRNQWKELILKPLSMPNIPKLTLTVVIDALDECEHEEDMKLILQLFVGARDLTVMKLKIFLTSRPDKPIRLGFQDMPEILHRSLLLHEIPRSVVERDIDVFLRHNLVKIRKDHNLLGDWPDDVNINLLVKKSDCLFIYIATVCRFVGDPHWRPQDRLSIVLESDDASSQHTAELDGMYMQILKLPLNNIPGEQDKSGWSKRFRHIVGSIVTLFDVISTTALAGVLGNVLVQEVNLTLDPLHSVLNIPRDRNLPIRLLHPSFRDFLINNKRCDDGRFYISQESAHMELSRSCLQLLAGTLKRDICNLRMPGTLIHEVQRSKIDHHLSRDVQYACRYWVDHLEQVSHERRVQIGLHDGGRFHVFLLEHFLHWLEALSLIGKLSEGVLLITKLEAMFDHNKHSALKAAVYDAKRFILSNRSIIEEAPLQSYVAALVFCPRQSVIKASCLNELPTWITRFPVVKDNWISSLQTLEGHTYIVAGVAFSCDGQLLASASFDKTVRLWDPATGVLQSDGRLLASASDDKTVRLWDPATGLLQSTLEGHTEEVTAVAFSGDGQLLAAASDDKTVRLWDPVTGVLQSTLEGHTNNVAAVAFSCDDQLLASASQDKTVRLWDPATGVLQSTLEGHTEAVTAVAFSGDGQLLASASWDQTVRLWDLATGVLQSTLEGHTNYVAAVAFSGDGRLLASASGDSTIRLWDLATRNLVQEFAAEGVHMLSFSPDQTQLETNRGRIQVSDYTEITSGRPILQSGCSLMLQENWLIWNGHKVLWLPSDWRPSCFAIRDNLIVMGHESGCVTFTELDSTSLSEIVEGGVCSTSAVGQESSQLAPF
ncbi:hypothetical protein MMC07_003005 [Pseudocyphellaria aurata]|nr:hypothetical protein [Pseudocyphellaria aurata]